MNEPNQYAYSALGERFAVEDPTDVDRMNNSRIKNDHLYEALNTSGFMSTTNPVSTAMVLSRKSLVRFPDTIETGTDENAQRVIFVDLDDPDQMWDLDEFMQLAQATSWYAELGAPPIHGAMWITEDQQSLIWWDREAGSIYMQFDTGGTDGTDANFIAGTTGWHEDVHFLDGVIRTVNDGWAAIEIDLLLDRAHDHTTVGIREHFGDISDRNAGTGYYTLVASVAVGHNNIYSVGACRDPEKTDSLGRPRHWWACGHSAGTSVYNPTDEDWYDTSSVSDFADLVLSPGGELVFIQSTGTRDSVFLRRSVFTITADAWGSDEAIDNNASDGSDIDWTNAAVFERPAVLPSRSWNGDGSSQIFIPSDQGMYIAHLNAADQDAKGGLIRFTDSEATPYMKGDVRAAWPLANVNDLTPASHNLTNNNTVTFASGGPTGSYADFVSASSMSLQLADHADFDGVTAFSAMLWFKLDIASGAVRGVATKWDLSLGSNQSWQFKLNSDETLSISLENSSSTTITQTSVALSTGKWYHCAVSWDGTTMTAYLNGQAFGSGAFSGTMDNSTAAVFLGAFDSDGAGTPSSFIDGQIGGVVISATAITAAEVYAEFARGKQRLTSTIDPQDSIPDLDVAATAADPSGRYVIVAYDNKTVHIFNELGVPVISDTYPGTTLRDVAVKSYPGQDTPSYIMAGSDQIEFVQPDRRLLG